MRLNDFLIDNHLKYIICKKWLSNTQYKLCTIEDNSIEKSFKVELSVKGFDQKTIIGTGSDHISAHQKAHLNFFEELRRCQNIDEKFIIKTYEMDRTDETHQKRLTTFWRTFFNSKPEFLKHQKNKMFMITFDHITIEIRSSSEQEAYRLLYYKLLQRIHYIFEKPYKYNYADDWKSMSIKTNVPFSTNCNSQSVSISSISPTSYQSPSSSSPSGVVSIKPVESPNDYIQYLKSYFQSESVVKYICEIIDNNIDSFSISSVSNTESNKAFQSMSSNSSTPFNNPTKRSYHETITQNSFKLVNELNKLVCKILSEMLVTQELKYIDYDFLCGKIVSNISATNETRINEAKIREFSEKYVKSYYSNIK